MKAPQRQALKVVGLLVALVVHGSVAELGAQAARRGRTPSANAPRILVSTFRSAERDAGVQAADAIRERITSDLAYKDFWIISKNDINGTLTASGFPPDSALSPTDLKTLATLLRSDEYITGQVTRAGDGYRVDARLVLTRDNALTQPLPAVSVKRPRDAAGQVSKAYQTARRQLDGEKKCVEHARAQRYAEAVAAAQAGIVEYPQATLARLCLISVYDAMKKPVDSVLALANEILAIDPRSKYALQFAAQSYDSLGRDSLAVQMYTRLLETDPTNPRLAETVVSVLARSGHPQVAVPIINEAVAQNPGDPTLVRLQWLILLTTKNWKEAIQVGEAMVKTDTASADTTFYTRLAAAYSADSQPQRAAEAVARGLQKFPSNVGLLLLHAQTLRAAGQLPQSIEAARKALAADPNAPRAYAMIAQTQMDMNQPDSALASLQQAASRGQDSSFVSQYALSLGNTLYRNASQTKTREDYLRALGFLELSQSLVKSPQAAFLIGASAFSVGQSAATDAPKAPKAERCTLARLAEQSFGKAQPALMEGGSIAPQAAAQYLNYIPQFTPVVQNQIKAFCK